MKKMISILKSWTKLSIEFQLEGLLGVKNVAGNWHWNTGVSKVSLVPKSNITLSGYYMLELSASNVSKPFNCTLYSTINCASNITDVDLCSETEGIKVRVPVIGFEPKTIKRVCFFVDNTTDLQLDFNNEPGACEGLAIKLVKLTAKRARQLLIKKLISNTWNFTLPSEINALYSKYDALFHKPAAVSYQSWIEKNEREEVSKGSFTDGTYEQPLISIICPTYNTKVEWLVACVESVLNQSYSNWELIIVDDASQDRSHIGYLIECADKDSRIKILFLDENQHISAATNAGVSIASGVYITFLDHDDKLALDALVEISNAISNNPNVKVIYSDEDLISEAGERIVPHFKSDWNPELLRAHNYVTHLCCYEAKLLASLGGMRVGYEGAQDYDLILRAANIVAAEDICHIPKILYHWRMVEGSSALSSDAKSYATEAGLKALKDSLLNVDSNALVVHSDRTNFYTVRYSLPESLPMVSIIIPTRDGIEVLRPCIETLLDKTSYESYEVIILDNGSVEKETLSFLSELSLKPNFKVVRDDGEFNYSRINNRAVTYAQGELICLLNNDIEVIDSNWLTEMVSVAIREEVGCVGAKLLYPDGTIQHAGVILGLGGYAAHSHRGLSGNKSGYFGRAQVRQQLSAVTGACLLIKRDVFDEVGGLDEAFQVAYNDVDFCLRVQALGYQNIYTPFAELIHHESKTRGEDTSADKIKRFDKEKQLLADRWGVLLKNDPFYNINLTRAREDFSI